jgi:hypothetical protein
MAMNASGPISLGGATVGQSVNLEIGNSATTEISFNTAGVRTLTGTSTNAVLIMPTNFYGKSLPFPAGNVSYGNLRALGQALTASGTGNTTATAGGTLTINSVSLGSYDYAVQNGSTLSSFTNGTWFTATEDTRSALIGIKGNLTINSGVTFVPDQRKLFTFIYVDGNLTLNGEVSMTDKGANHNGTGNSGGSVTAGNILLASGTYSGVSNPQIPSSGGAGGPGSSGSGNPGTAGTSGGTGGGGGGGSNGGLGGNGAAGTSYVGAAGGGGERVGSAATPGTANGGAGGNGVSGGGLGGGGGGAGQPGGAPGQNGPFPTFPGETGIGGVVIIMVTGTFSGSGTITSVGRAGGLGWNAGGGGSGGGSITVFYGTDTSSITPNAAGGSGGGSNAGGAPGGNGGAGTARKLSF